MSQKALCIIDGKKYMSTKAASNLWGISTRDIRAACIDGRIIGATKDSSGYWIIPVEARQPIQIKDIRNILIAILKLKNDHERDRFNIRSTKSIKDVFSYLSATGYLESLDTAEENDMPYQASLTDKGFDLVITGNTVTHTDWLSTAANIIQITDAIIKVWNAVEGKGII